MERRRTHGSSKNPTNHLCYLSLNGSDAPACEVEKQLGVWFEVGEITDKQRSLHWHEEWASLWLARFDVCRRQNARIQSLVVAMRCTPVAERPADAAADDALTVTRHAAKRREVIVVPAISGAPLQAGSGEGDSAPSNPVPNLPKPTVARAQPSSAAVESSHHPSGERVDSSGPGGDVPLEVAQAVEPTTKSHAPWRSMMNVSFQRGSLLAKYADIQLGGQAATDAATDTR